MGISLTSHCIVVTVSNSQSCDPCNWYIWCISSCSLVKVPEIMFQIRGKSKVDPKDIFVDYINLTRSRTCLRCWIRVWETFWKNKQRLFAQVLFDLCLKYKFIFLMHQNRWASIKTPHSKCWSRESQFFMF